MSLSNLFSKLLRNDREPSPIKQVSMHEKFDDDAIQSNHYNEAKQISSYDPDYDPSTDPVRLALRNPDILPCGADVTAEFWLKRIQLWGKLHIDYIDPQGRKTRTDVSGLLDAINAPEEMFRIFGKWNFKGISYKKFEMYREWYDNGNKRRMEKFIVEIELDKDIQDAFNGKF